MIEQVEQQKKKKLAAEAAAQAALPKPKWWKFSQAKPLPPPPETAKELAPVLDNSLAWGSFMALSSNTRYQIVNGIEERIVVRPAFLLWPASCCFCGRVGS